MSPFPSFIQAVMEDSTREYDYFMIPMTGCPTKYYSITFDGWNHFKLDINDDAFINAINTCAETLKSFIKVHKDRYAISEPSLSITVDGKIILRIGTMEIEKYEFLYGDKK